MRDVVSEYLCLMDSQREAAFGALEGLSEDQIWQRPRPREWCIGEILDHNVRVYESMLPWLKISWLLMDWYGQLRRKRPYPVEIDNVYKRSNFPMWTGFLWTPKYNSKRRVQKTVLQKEAESVHRRARKFYEGKALDVMGNIYGYDPVIGVVNLIQTLKVGVDHDQLHYDDVIKLASALQHGGE